MSTSQVVRPSPQEAEQTCSRQSEESSPGCLWRGQAPRPDCLPAGADPCPEKLKWWGLPLPEYEPAVSRPDQALTHILETEVPPGPARAPAGAHKPPGQSSHIHPHCPGAPSLSPPCACVCRAPLHRELLSPWSPGAEGHKAGQAGARVTHSCPSEAHHERINTRTCCCDSG